MMLQAQGVPIFILSDNPDEDIGIVRLDNFGSGSQFRKTIEQLGYEPLHISDIDTICNFNAGSEAYAFGFPGTLSYTEKSYVWRPYWEASFISLPTVSKGTIVENVKSWEFIYKLIHISLVMAKFSIYKFYINLIVGHYQGCAIVVKYLIFFM